MTEPSSTPKPTPEAWRHRLGTWTAVLASALLLAVIIIPALLPRPWVPHGVSIGWAFLTGWLTYPAHARPYVTVQPLAIGLFVLASCLLGWGIHALCRWLHRGAKPPSPGRQPATPGWRARWSVLITVLLLAVLAATMSAGHVVHQIGWLATAPTPMLQSRLRVQNDPRWLEAMAERVAYEAPDYAKVHRLSLPQWLSGHRWRNDYLRLGGFEYQHGYFQSHDAEHGVAYFYMPAQPPETAVVWLVPVNKPGTPDPPQALPWAQWPARYAQFQAYSRHNPAAGVPPTAPQPPPTAAPSPDLPRSNGPPTAPQPLPEAP